MERFTHESLPGRVVFGRGRSAELPDEVRRLGLSRVLVLSTPGQAALAQHITNALGSVAVGIHPHAVMHVPEAVADAAVQEATRLQADGIVAVGGGSTIGLGKAVALKTGLPQLALPTTYAGSEMTPIWGMTRDGVKTTGRDQKVLPRTVIYDVDLSAALPPRVAAVSGMNAIAHCVEGLYAAEVSPLVALMAEEGIRALAQGLPRIMQNPNDLAARELALHGAWLAGCVLGLVGMALHHKLCHTLGGSFELPHAEVHSVMIPQVTAFNAEAAPAAMARIARALNAAKAADTDKAADVAKVPGTAAAVDNHSAAAGLHALALQLGVPLSLRELGMRADDLERAADLATRNPYYNPRQVTRENVLALLASAYEGRAPA
jgi:maleylacetate reductase